MGLDKEELVSRAASRLVSYHFDGNGCGTHGENACVFCFGPSPMSAWEIAQAVIDVLAESGMIVEGVV